MASRQRECFNEINITPLTDIFLVLLIIMMVIAPLLDEQGLNLTVPENVVAEQIKESKVMAIDVSADGEYYTNGVRIPAEKLGVTIKENLSMFPDGLMIRSDEDSTHGAVVKLMDEARNAGVKNISIGQI